MAIFETPAAAFAPQRSNTAPGYEIWFAVIHDPVERLALWLRYSRYVPKGGDKPAQAILWASLFSATDSARHSFNARSVPLEAASFAGGRITIDTNAAGGGSPAVLGPDYIVGEIKTPSGNLRWDLELLHDFAPYVHGPERLAKVSRTHSVVVSPFGRARGTLRLGTAKVLKLKDARTMFTHIWGADRVPELYWCYAPFLAGGARPGAASPGSGKSGSAGRSSGSSVASISAVEAIYVKPSALTPAVCFGTALTGEGRIIHDHALTRGVFGGNKFDYPKQHFRLSFDGQRVEVAAAMNQKQKTGYIYRGADGAPFFIVQSDVSSVECRMKNSEGRDSKFISPDFAAVEFHGAKPWPGVMYMDPYD
ncbi:MAG: hypothetical protein RIF32_06495 [Leptospirales bacterium]|jgi:hypothetical protein